MAAEGADQGTKLKKHGETAIKVGTKAVDIYQALPDTIYNGTNPLGGTMTITIPKKKSGGA